MPESISSDSSSPEDILDGFRDELLDLLDKARKLEDLISSLKAQKYIIEALLATYE